MIFGYARVSTQEQNIKTQIDLLKEAGAERIFYEYASGKKKNRPELEKLIEQLREDDQVLVYKIDRLSRRTVDALSLCDRIAKRGAGLKCLTEPFDMTTPAGKASAQMLMVLAELEANNISERTKAGLATAKKSGRIGGRPPALSTFAKGKVRKAFADGYTISTLAQKYSVSRNTIRRAVNHK